MKDFEIIPSIRDLRYLEEALALDCPVVQLSGAHIGNLRKLVEHCHNKGKKVLINHELVGGLGNDRTAFRMLQKLYQVDWLIGSSVSKFHMFQNLGMRTIFKIALVDSIAVENAFRFLPDVRCDALELRPFQPAMEFLPQFREVFQGDIYIAGFVNTPEKLEASRQAGFRGAMTSTRSLWSMGSYGLHCPQGS